MPLGRYKDFGQLMVSVARKKGVKNAEAYAASVARKINPDFDEEAAAKRRQNAKESKR